jgi:hypothetical protein
MTFSVHADACYSSAKDIPATCNGGTLTQDTVSGSCRTLVCTNGASSMKAMACDKPDSGAKAYFEMYKQAATGSGVSSICLGSTCVGSNGYAKSGNFPICSGTPTNQTNTTAPPTNQTACFSAIKNAPLSCTGGSVTSDVVSGTCRTIQCAGGSGSIKVMACDKPDSGTKTYFEAYRQAASGAVPKVCFGTTCIQNEGYVKSGSYPICGTPVNQTNGTNPANSTGSLVVNQDFPQDSNVVFTCSLPGPSYTWNFGDGTVFTGVSRNDFYYHYYNSGTYTASCSANGQTASKSVSVVMSPNPIITSRDQKETHCWSAAQAIQGHSIATATATCQPARSGPSRTGRRPCSAPRMMSCCNTRSLVTASIA